uniref:Pentatricopeptide repeat-containing protein n=1 Tax=Salix viminalis TaxID=40686 RepID=A0A6N2LPG2_SALVM
MYARYSDLHILVDGLCKEGMVSEAPRCDYYNTLINGLCKTGTQAWCSVFKRWNMRVNRCGDLQYNHRQLCKDRLVNDAWNSYLKCGSWHSTDVVTYNSIVHGQLNEATRLFKEMVGKDVMPDTVTSIFWLTGSAMKEWFQKLACL